MAGWKPKKQIADGAPAPLMIPLDDLEPNMCRWPHGDPRDAGFGFCGHEKSPGVSYCRFHAALSVAGWPTTSRATRPLRIAA